MAKVKKKIARGPTADRIKIDGDWETAIGVALKKPRPKAGWPNPDKKEVNKKH